MIDLGTTDFYFDVPSMSRRAFEKYSTQLFDEWAEQIGSTLTLPDYSLVLEVEEGSVKGAGKIAAVLSALYIGIGTYGDFIQGLQTIGSQLSSVSDFLVERAATPLNLNGSKPKVRKRGGSLAQLQRLFVRVQNREMTAEQAMHEAEVIFGDEATSAPDFMHKLHRSLVEIPLYPQQLSLISEPPVHEDVLPGSGKKRRSRTSRPPMPGMPPPQPLRVQVWRETKTGRRQMRILNGGTSSLTRGHNHLTSGWTSQV